MNNDKELVQGGHVMAVDFNDRVYPEMPNPTNNDVFDPMFQRIWQIVKTWDVNVPEYYKGYCGANGSHVKLLLDAITPAHNDFHERVLRIVEELVGLNPKEDSKDGDLLTVLSHALVRYENKYYPITDLEKDSAGDSLMPNEFWDMRIKKIMERTPWPNSLSTYLAFKQLQHEIEYTFQIKNGGTSDQLTRPSQFVPVYQCRLKGVQANWSEVTQEQIAKYKTKPSYYEKLEFRTLYRGWE